MRLRTDSDSKKGRQHHALDPNLNIQWKGRRSTCCPQLWSRNFHQRIKDDHSKDLHWRHNTVQNSFRFQLTPPDADGLVPPQKTLWTGMLRAQCSSHRHPSARGTRAYRRRGRALRLWSLWSRWAFQSRFGGESIGTKGRNKSDPRYSGRGNNGIYTYNIWICGESKPEALIPSMLTFLEIMFIFCGI